MTVHVFKIVIRERLDDDMFNKVSQGRLDDAAFLVDGPLSIVEFDREAESQAEALAGAIGQLSEAGLTPLRVMDGDILSLQDIADRIGQSRESVRRYAAGSRGPGGFPPPINPSREGTTFYRWSDVAPWFREHLGLDVDKAEHALVMANLILQVRLLTDDVDRADALLALLGDA